MPLTAKQVRFCQEYVIDLNAAAAAERAGYSKKTARSIGAENLTKPDIQNKIQELQDELRIKAGIKAETVIDELISLGFWNIRDFVSAGNTINDLTAMERKKLRPVTGIKVTERTDSDGNAVTTTELKMADKRAALVDLGRHLGIFKEDNNQKAVKIKVTRK